MRIIVATNCLANGIDTSVEEIVVLHQEDSFEGMVQWAGRAGRRGKPGHAIIYGAKWLSDNVTRTAAETRAVKERCTKAQVDPAFILFHSPSDNQCSRWAISDAFGESYSKPPDRHPCCGHCDPNDGYLVQNKLHQVAIDRMSELASGGKGKDPKTDRKYAAQRPYEIKGSALAKLKDWRRERWLNTPGSNDFVGPMTIIPDSILVHLSQKLHILSTRECFDQVVRDWKPAKCDQHGSALYAYAVALITKLDMEHQERRQVAILEGTNELEMGESNPLDVKEIEEEELPDMPTTIVQGVTRTSNKRNIPPTPSNTHKHRNTQAKREEPIEKLFIRITRPPRTS